MSENKKTFLSLQWFKDQITEVTKNVAEKIVTKKLENLVEQLENEEVVEKKPYLNNLRTKENFIVVLKNGSILTKFGATDELVNKVKSAKSEAEVIELMSSEEVKKEKEEIKKQEEEIKLIQSNFDILVETGDFEVRDNSVYMVGINRSMPKLLVNRFTEVVNDSKAHYEILQEDERYVALKRFWYWTCLNSRAEVADKLYDFLERNSFKINKYGFFAALRNVVTINTEKDKELVDFVSNAYNKIKSIWKKNPGNFEVFDDNGYVLAQGDKRHDYNKHVGNLRDLYLDLPNLAENRYTDDWTKTFDIRIGKAVNMKPEDCCWSTQDCAASGLHFTSDQINYVGCGDTSVLVLINPMTVVGIGEAKGRCYEYFPVMTVPREEATQILHDTDFDTIDLGEEYAAQQIEGLEERIKENIAAEAKKHEFNLPTISTKEITNIVKSLSEIKEELNNRVVSI